MSRTIHHRACLWVVTIGLAILPVQQPAMAAIIDTGTAIELAERGQQIDRINAYLAQDSVREALIHLGVAPEDASARVSTLTTAELELLESQLESLPAGGTGVVEVVGIVAIVLIVLELLNVTNFFTEF